jgi:hypothetical protein
LFTSSAVALAILFTISAILILADDLGEPLFTILAVARLLLFTISAAASALLFTISAAARALFLPSSELLRALL